MESATNSLHGRKFILGVTASIAAYKSTELVRMLKTAGADVQVIMSRDAHCFIGPLTLATLSQREVLSEIFPESGQATSWTRHVSLGIWADLLVIAPATAQTIACLAHGFADTLLGATVLSARCPVLVCPAMDRDMYGHPAVSANLLILRSHGHHVMPAEFGELASGLSGQGRMPAPTAILERIRALLAVRSGPLSGMKALVTAGPTREPLDPVRVLTNPSTGTMGYALACSLARRGASVILVSGPTALAPPARVETICVTTAEEMRQAVMAHHGADIIFMAAAVADYAPASASTEKLKKETAPLSLNLSRTPDILLELGQHRSTQQVIVGFAMETDDGLNHARSKLAAKSLDWIVLNYVNEDGAGFGTGTNRATLLGRDGTVLEIPTMPKEALAEALLDNILDTVR